MSNAPWTPPCAAEPRRGRSVKQNDRWARHDVGPIGLMRAHNRHMVTAHTVTAHDVGRVDPTGRPVACLVTELLEGRTLDRLTGDGVPDLGGGAIHGTGCAGARPRPPRSADAHPSPWRRSG